MTIAEQFTFALRAAGYRYDREDDVIYDGDKPASWQKLLKLIPGFTLDDLEAWQDAELEKRPLAKHGSAYGSKNSG